MPARRQFPIKEPPMFLSRWLKSEPRTRRHANRVRPTLESLDARDLPSGGVLDPTFSGDGVTSTLIANGNCANAVTTAPDGKVITAGYSATNSLAVNVAVTRYNVNGTLDTTFGNGGSVSGVSGRGYAVTLQADGKILVAGRSGDDFAVIRYTATGALDKSFGKNGVATIDIGARSVDDGRGMVVQSDGRIVVAGTTRSSSQTVAKLALVRLTTSGVLDTSFGARGKVVRSPSGGSLPQSAPDERALGIVLDPGTNKLVVAGSLHYSTPGTAVFRFNANGTPDTSFSGDGELTLTGTDVRDTCAVAVQPDHKVVVAGMHYDGSGSSAGEDFGMVRLNPDGTSDAAFGTGGLVYTPEPIPSAAKDVEIQADGQIVLFGNHGTELMLTRYNAADGSLDTSFGTNGSVTGSSLGLEPMYCMDMALAPDGRIAVAGSHSGGEIYAIVARFLATGPTIGSFTASSSTVTAGSPVTLTASGVTAQNPGSTVTQVAIYADTNGDGKLDANDALVGYASQTATGTWTLNLSTTGWSVGSYTLFARATDSLGAPSDPISLNLTVI
jgi:uncharacterized delta-60 repeat protein